MKLHRLPLFAAVAAFTLPQLTLNAQSTVVATDPVGFTTVTITPGTGTTKRNTFFSLPLLEVPSSFTGQVSGVITGVGAKTLSNSSAGWSAGALSQAATPYLIAITSGAAAGSMFLVSTATDTANTATTVTVSSNDTLQIPNLTTLGIVPGTDTYRIYACDTLSSFFGTPATSGVQGGTSTSNADTIVITVNGSSSTYYYNTSLNRWARSAFQNPNANNVPLLPYYGMQYQRLAGAPLSFVTTGNVPTTQRKVQVSNQGLTLLAQYWPVNSTLGSLGIQNLPNWRTGTSVTTGDNVNVISSGSTTSYFYNGTNWRRGGFNPPPSSDNVSIPIGSAVQINRKGMNAGYSTLTQLLPYTL